MDGLMKRWHVTKYTGGGVNENKIREFHYIGNDISTLMNEGAANFHQGLKMDFSVQDTICDLIKEIKQKYGKKLSLFYGLSVSVRYAVRDALDLIEVAEASELSIYNRLSMTLDEKTQVSVYGTGKQVYLVSLPKLLEGLKKRGLFAKYCTANMQYGKDGNNTVRASLVIADSQEIMNQFIIKYEECIDKSMNVEGVVKGEWKHLEELLNDGKTEGGRI